MGAFEKSKEHFRDPLRSFLTFSLPDAAGKFGRSEKISDFYKDATQNEWTKQATDPLHHLVEIVKYFY